MTEADIFLPKCRWACNHDHERLKRKRRPLWMLLFWYVGSVGPAIRNDSSCGRQQATTKKPNNNDAYLFVCVCVQRWQEETPRFVVMDQNVCCVTHKIWSHNFLKKIARPEFSAMLFMSTMLDTLQLSTVIDDALLYPFSPLNRVREEIL